MLSFRMSPSRSDAQKSELAAAIAQQIGTILSGTLGLAAALSNFDDKTTHEEPTKTKAKPSKKSRKRKASKNRTVIAPIPLNQVGPSQVAPPPAKKPYRGKAPLCNQCNYHHYASVLCRKCSNCGRFGHTVNVCRLAATPNQAMAVPIQLIATPHATPGCPNYPHGICFNDGYPNYLN